ELYGKTLGIFGLGKIGATVARRAKAFKMDILGCDPFISAEYAAKLGIQLVTLEELLAKSDYITLHVPATKETRGSIGEKQIAMMKPTARLINVARGGIVDEAALCRAVEEGLIAGIAFDVFEQEPPSVDNPLLKLDNAITTPHLGASTKEAQVNVAVDIAEQIVEVLSGKPSRSAV
ncbi:MAG TPA: phosphoglycerate dehydrogenase, partial [Armatimonadetes bacterium]|nr:phosphoglycerate dehydrogenase [Armatimonadota bacterium]